MLKTFDRYILKEITPPFLTGLLLFSFVLLMNQVLFLADLLISKGISLKSTVEIFIYLIPAILAFTLPMSILTGILAGLSRLSSDSEIVAFKTLGVSFKRMLRPLLLFSFLGWVFTSFLTLYLAPRSNHKWVQTLVHSVLAKVQFRINPREFNEMIPHTVLFTQDISHEKKWKNIFLYTDENPDEPTLILAKEGMPKVYPELKRATIEFSEGVLHSFPLSNPEDYRVTMFRELEQEIDVEKLFSTISQKKRASEKDISELAGEMRALRGDVKELRARRAQLLRDRVGREDPRLAEVDNNLKMRNTDRIYHLVEIHKKFAFPFAALIFGFLALPLGATTKKGGRTSGFTLSLGIMAVYYVFITGGEALAKDGKMSPFLGIWGGNIILLLTASCFFVKSVKESPLLSWVGRTLRKRKRAMPYSPPGRKKYSFHWPRLALTFPNILDRYVIRKYLFIFFLVFLSISLVFVIATFIERIDDVYENDTSVLFVFEEIIYDLPAFIHYNILPTAILAATLLTLGLLTKFNEVTAMKACGISIYRLVVPLILIALAASIFSFYLQENILPYSNKRREEAWNRMHNIPARTYSYLDRRWVLSRSKDRIYHYSYFDPKEAAFSRLSVFDIDPASWSLKRRVYADKGYLRGNNLALEKSWVRNFSGGMPVSYQRKDAMAMVVEEEKSFFLVESKEPDQMGFGELRRYIQDIEESGFETAKFKVDLYFKTSFPFVSLIMAVFAIPFAFSMGKRGTLVGIGLSIGIAMLYWGAIGAFKSLGNIQFLPPLLAAWGPNIIFGLVGVYFLFSLRT